MMNTAVSRDVYRMILFIALIIALVSCAGEKNGVAEIPAKPNIVFILADDLGYGDLGCYGQNKIETPNLDRLASKGILFTQHYAGSTVCAPSRSSLLTGLHTGHTPVRGNREIMPEGQHPMADSITTLAELLKEAGYVTGAFGKWGLGFVGSDGDPLNQGFDIFYGFNCQRQAHRYYPEYLWRNQEKDVLEGNDFNHKVVYAPDRIHQAALQFIEQHHDSSFFMYYPSTIPHAELVIPENPLLNNYKERFSETPFVNTKAGADYGDESFDVKLYCSQPEPHATFAAMVSYLDRQVGEILDKLVELGIEDRTLVLFSSDNGPHMEGGADPDFFRSSGDLRGYKRDLYEGGIRVPLLAAWPGVIQQGVRSDHVSAFWDLMPTLAELAGVECRAGIDGLSYLPTLLGEEQIRHEALYWEFHEQGGKQAVREGQWKAVRLDCDFPKRTRTELYDLWADPEETSNIAENHPEIVERLGLIMEQEHSPNPDFPFGRDDR